MFIEQAIFLDRVASLRHVAGVCSVQLGAVENKGILTQVEDERHIVRVSATRAQPMITVTSRRKESVD